jgi:quercetin dioxygenase-like cupin family protein
MTKIKLGDFQLLSGPDAPPPTALGPDSDGALWKVWQLSQDGDFETSYGRTAPGKRIGAHIHPDAVHYSVILKGVGLLWVDGEVSEVHPGDLWYIPRHALHDWFSVGDEVCWVADITAPPIDWKLMDYKPERDPEIQEAFDKAISKMRKL